MTEKPQQTTTIMNGCGHALVSEVWSRTHLQRSACMRVQFRTLLLRAAIGLAVVAALAGCGGPPPTVAPPPPEVTVSNPIERDVTSYLEYTGNTVAFESVDIRPRVSGYVESISFAPRARVKSGEVLFVIDRGPYKARVEQAEAAVDAAKAALRIREIELDKYTRLGSKEVIAELKLDEARAACDMARAEVERAKANLDSAKLDLEFTQVKSPINGRVSRNFVDRGNLVGANENTLLANVVNDDPIYVYFNMSEIDLLALIRRDLKKNGTADAQELVASVTMGLADERGYPHKGTIDYTDTKVDPNTGTIQVRAVFPNSEGLLVPGMFSRVRVPVETRSTILVPDTAVLTDQGGKYVLVCNEGNIVEMRRVRPGRLVKDLRVIEDGLTRKEKVIVNGLQRARPGAPVNPAFAAMESLKTALDRGELSAN